MENRGAGILMHISSLPSPYGIGDMGISAYEFIEFLKKANQKYWQVLPIGHTGLGNSPYQSCLCLHQLLSERHDLLFLSSSCP